MQSMIVANFLMIFNAQMNIFFIIKVKIFLIITIIIK